MKNPECTPLEPEVERELLAAFPQWLDGLEVETAEEFFPKYLFYTTVRDGARDCQCMACRESFTVYRMGNHSFFGKKHNDDCSCPRCGQSVTLKSSGRMSTCNSLTTSERVVQLTRHGDWLLAQAGWMRRDFSIQWDCFEHGLDFYPYRRYAFAPGKRMMWYLEPYIGTWRKRESIQEPFPPACFSFGESFQPYWVLGWDQLFESSLRYCQFDRWYDDWFGGTLSEFEWDGEMCKICWLIRYLAEYTRRPQMEMLVKLEHTDVVSALVLDKRTNGQFVNWKAKSPADFFRLSKGDYKAFQERGMSLKALQRYRKFAKSGQVKDLKEYLALREQFGNAFDDLCAGAAQIRVKLDRVARYLIGQAEQLKNISAAYWKDYIDAAVKLGYDLKREDVALPKDLPARHDAATGALESEEDKKLRRAYLKRRAVLEQQYCYCADGLEILVPEDARAIVNEGKLLSHCVGGYAARHCRGELTILFLRRSEQPSVPYVTIEMTVDPNPRKLEIKQIHGYKNDRGSVSPGIIHREFLDRWLEWVHDGSPRDSEGKPVERDAVRIEVGAA